MQNSSGPMTAPDPFPFTISRDYNSAHRLIMAQSTHGINGIKERDQRSDLTRQPVWLRRSPLLPLLVGGLPVLLTSAIALVLYVDIPFSDQWQTVLLVLQKSMTGALTLNDIMGAHIEHRMASFYIVWLPLAHLTHWNGRYEIALSLICSGISLWLVWRQFHARGFSPWLTVLAAWLLFSMAAYENWYQSYNLIFVMCTTAYLAGIHLLIPKLGAVNGAGSISWPRLLFAILMGFVCTFSLASGFLYWPFAWVALGLARPRPAQHIAMLIGAAVALYGNFNGFSRPAGYGSFLDVLGNPGVLVLYFTSWLGAPLLIYGGSFVVGAIGLLGLGWLCGRLKLFRSDQIRAQLPFLMWMGYALVAGAAVMAGRVQFGWEQSLSPRYVAISLLFWLGLVGLLASAPITLHFKRVLIGGMLALSMVSYTGGTYMGIKHRHIPLRNAQRAILAGDSSDAVLKVINDHPNDVRAALPFLQQYHLSLYRGTEQ